MNNDKQIRALLEELGSEISYVLAQENFDAHTDRCIEDIVDKTKKVEKLHKGNFKD